MLTVVGTGRCGTRWLTQVLRDAGIDAGHEHVFTPDTVRTADVQVDVSWLALTHYNPHPTLLIAREPAGCIGSLIDCGLFTDGNRYTRAVARCIELTGIDPHRPPDPHPIGQRTTVLTWADLPDEVVEVAGRWGW